MESNPTKFTVIIPTRERADTLGPCLRTVVHQNYDNLEILVSDNLSQDRTEQVVRGIGDSRVKYINTGRRVGMSANFEFALSHIKDGWVTYLGDDDGLLPNALDFADKVIRKTGCKAISSKWHHYTWPNFDGIARPNWLTVRMGKGYVIRNAKLGLIAALRGKHSYLELPGIYIGGFADYQTLARLRNNSGKFFCSRTPDVYAAVALASALDTYVYIDQPLAICGASAHSIGASHFGWSRNASASAVFDSEAEIPFHRALGDGKVRSIHLLLYEAYLQASHLHNDFADASMSEQLALSIAHSPNGTSSVEDCCKAIAEAQGLDFGAIRKSARRIALKSKVRRTYAKLRSPFCEFAIDGRSLGLMDVFDASIACQSLYFQSTSNSLWKIKKVLRKFSTG